MTQTAGKKKDDKTSISDLAKRTADVPLELFAGIAEHLGKSIRAIGDEIDSDNISELDPTKNGLMLGLKEGLKKALDGAPDVIDKTYDKAKKVMD